VAAGFYLVLAGFSWLLNTCNEQIRNQRKPNKTEIKPITVLRQDFNRAGLYSGQGLIVAGVNSAKGLQGFILVLSGFSWLLNACNERMWNQRKPNKTKIKPITVLRKDFNNGRTL
jgi:hypothetical protein